ncbi:MAG: hypothetical protein WCX84_08225 [Syntrophales bacterium]|nr:hypothetical protein [Syntrophales bacterium]
MTHGLTGDHVDHPVGDARRQGPNRIEQGLRNGRGASGWTIGKTVVDPFTTMVPAAKPICAGISRPSIPRHNIVKFFISLLLFFGPIIQENGYGNVTA